MTVEIRRTFILATLFAGTFFYTGLTLSHIDAARSVGHVPDGWRVVQADGQASPNAADEADTPDTEEPPGDDESADDTDVAADVFDPSEDISEDFAVPFPVDI